MPAALKIEIESNLSNGQSVRIEVSLNKTKVEFTPPVPLLTATDTRVVRDMLERAANAILAYPV